MSSAVSWPPDHLLSLAEWDALPEDNTRRYELVEGILLVSPRPVWDHQVAAGELFYQLRAQLPSELRVVQDFEVTLFGAAPPTVRVPDLVIVPTALGSDNPARVAAEDVLLTVEVISPGSRRLDRVTKLNEYAEAGIENYWIVDLERPVTVTAFELVGQEYKLVSETLATLSVTSPVPLTVDVQALVP